jgi:aerobic-type carbon monoxide dehydrogenase small subunit (CoxS/CutS family)
MSDYTYAASELVGGSERQHEPDHDDVVELTLNGVHIRARVSAGEGLSSFLRNHAGCASVHVGCEEGVCGACTVLVDGVSVRSCLAVAGQVSGCRVLTAEGVSSLPGGASLQQAFVERHAAQCGYCTPGFMMIGLELLAEYAEREPPDELELRQRLSAVVCRCTGYASIVAAFRQVLGQNSCSPGEAEAPQHERET